MKAWAKSFYLSAAWEKTRAAYLMSQDYICERCGQPAKIVHHKRWLNRENINDMINKMSWAFSVAEESYDRETHTRTILKIKKVYDVSAVSIPANGDTEISARAFASRSYEQERQELLKRRAAILKIRASL